MRKRIGPVALVLFGLSTLVVAARGDEEKVALDKVPAAVMEAVKAKYPNAEIKGAEKEVEKGKTTYEIALKDGDDTLEVSLKEDGTILAVEKAIAVKDLPRAVSEAVMAKYPKAKIKKAEEVTAGKKVTYEVVVKVEGKKDRELTVDPQGKILEDEDD